MASNTLLSHAHVSLSYAIHFQAFLPPFIKQKYENLLKDARSPARPPVVSVVSRKDNGF